MEKYSSLRTRGLILSGPGAFRGSSLHKSLLIPAVVIVMQSIGLYGGGSRRDAVSLSVVGVTFENTDENCWFSACALVNGVVYSMPLSSIRLGIPRHVLPRVLNKTPEPLVSGVRVTIAVWRYNIF